MGLNFSAYYENDGHKMYVEDSDIYITHNLTDMASEAWVYEVLWRPGEKDKLKNIKGTVDRAINEMREDPERFKKHNPPNGFGTYESFLNALIAIHSLCTLYPNAYIESDV